MPFDGVSNNPVLECLLEARERVARGWCQGVFESHGRVCAMRALGFGENGNYPTIWAAAELVSQAVAVLAGDQQHLSWVDWQDAPGRTQAEVLAAFDRAIALAVAPDTVADRHPPQSKTDPYP